MTLRYPYPVATIRGKVTAVEPKSRNGELAVWGTEVSVQTEPNGGLARVTYAVRDGFQPADLEKSLQHEVEVVVALGARPGSGNSAGRAFLNLTGAEAPKVLSK